MNFTKLNDLTANLTSFRTFLDLCNAESGYRPTIRATDRGTSEATALCDAYDLYQFARGDARRAVRDVPSSVLRQFPASFPLERDAWQSIADYLHDVVRDNYEDYEDIVASPEIAAHVGERIVREIKDCASISIYAPSMAADLIARVAGELATDIDTDALMCRSVTKIERDAAAYMATRQKHFASIARTLAS